VVRTRAAAVTPDTMFPLPQTAVEAVKQAAEAIKRGLDANLTRQQVPFHLPMDHLARVASSSRSFILHRPACAEPRRREGLLQSACFHALRSGLV
jgi:uncharacterized protein (DUF924 family)